MSTQPNCRATLVALLTKCVDLEQMRYPFSVVFCMTTPVLSPWFARTCAGLTLNGVRGTAHGSAPVASCEQYTSAASGRVERAGQVGGKLGETHHRRQVTRCPQIGW